MKKGKKNEGLLQMSVKELKRAKVMDRLERGLLTQVEAGAELGLSDRHIRRLLGRYRIEGSEGMVSRRRGLPGNHKHSDDLRRRVRELVKQYYSDFKPGYANEYLSNQHNISISRETFQIGISVYHRYGKYPYRTYGKTTCYLHLFDSPLLIQIPGLKQPQ